MTKITNTYVLDKAKMSVLLLIMLFTCPLAFAQSEPETAKPLTDMEVVRKVAFLDIEGKYWLSGNFWLVSFKISYLCLPLFYETRTTPSCHPSGCAYRQL